MALSRDFRKYIYDGEDINKYKLLLKLYPVEYYAGGGTSSEKTLTFSGDNKPDAKYQDVKNDPYIFPIMQSKIDNKYSFTWGDLPEGQGNAINLVAREAMNVVLDKGSEGVKKLFKDTGFGNILEKGGDILGVVNDAFKDEEFKKNVARQNNMAFTEGLKKVFENTNYKTFDYEASFILEKDFIRLGREKDSALSSIFDPIKELKFLLTPSQSKSNISGIVLSSLKSLEKFKIGPSESTENTSSEEKLTNREKLKKAVTDTVQNIKNSAINKGLDKMKQVLIEQAENLSTKASDSGFSELAGLNIFVMSYPYTFIGYIKSIDITGKTSPIIRYIGLSAMTKFNIKIPVNSGFFSGGIPREVKIKFSLEELVPFHKGTENYKPKNSPIL